MILVFPSVTNIGQFTILGTDNIEYSTAIDVGQSIVPSTRHMRFSKTVSATKLRGMAVEALHARRSGLAGGYFHGMFWDTGEVDEFMMAVADLLETNAISETIQ